jgi:hypothetical protein
MIPFHFYLKLTIVGFQQYLNLLVARLSDSRHVLNHRFLNHYHRAWILKDTIAANTLHGLCTLLASFINKLMRDKLMNPESQARRGNTVF